MARDLGAVWLGENRCRFRVWAPHHEELQLHIVSPEDRLVSMQKRTRGYHQVTLDNISPGTRYKYRLSDGDEYPDPASAYQPEGVHGPSEVVSHDFDWKDTHWAGFPIERYIIYELHVGTFTPEGTFDAIIPHLDELRDLGITAIELMPLGQFPGSRNWGYDSVALFAVQNSYGGPDGLKRLVEACHQRGLAVVLDVVYNHIGPEGNYLPRFGDYFTDRYKTPWGPALNFDDVNSDEVRHFFIENARYWLRDFHIDSLRLDAVHAILDHSALNFLEELSDAVHALGTGLNRRIYAIAESALNDTRLIRPVELGGFGLDAQWNDDFHHSIHTLLTKEREGYYVDFGDFQHMAQAFSEGFVYSGRYSATHGRRHGNSSRSVPSVKFVVFAQNHDQIGNRMLGERLSQLVSLEAAKLAAAAVLLSPFVPLLFMGDEYGEPAPFQYFVSHGDPALVEAVRKGRKEEFASFKWESEPPDPQSEETFQRSKLNHQLKSKDPHRRLLEFHRELLRLRTSIPALTCLSKDDMDVASFDHLRILMVRRWSGDSEVLTIFNFNDQPSALSALPAGPWRKILDSTEARWGGTGGTAPPSTGTQAKHAIELSPQAVLVLEKETED